MNAIALLGLPLAAATAIWFARRESNRSPWRDVAAVLSVGSAVALFNWQPLLLADVSIPRGGGDLVSFLYPRYAFNAATIAAGEFPFWNPHQLGGAPHLADVQSGITYPLNLLTFLLVRPFTYDAMVGLVIIHQGIAGITAYALARVVGANRVAAAGGGIAFALSGFIVAHAGHLNMVAATSWVPGLLAATAYAARSRSIAWSSIAGGLLALVILAGHTQVALYAALVTFVVWYVAQGVKIPDRAAWGGLITTGVVGALCSAILLVPLSELARFALRGQLTYERASEFAASPLGLITFVLPTFFGTGGDDYWGLPWSLNETYGYVGLVGLGLVSVAIAAPRRSPLPLLLVVGALLSVLVALGEMTPLHGLLYRYVPGFDRARAPGRFLLFVDLALAILIALGLSRVAVQMSWRERPSGRALARAARAVAILAWAVGVPLGLTTMVLMQGADPAIFARAQVAARALIIAASSLTAWAVLVSLWPRRAGTTLAAGAVGLLFLDLFVSSASFNPTRDDLVRGFAHPDEVAAVRAATEGGYRVDARTGIADTWQPDLATLRRLDDVGGLTNPIGLRAFDAFWEELGSRSAAGYDLLSARALIARTGTPLDDRKFREAKSFPSGLTLFLNDRALPRAFVAPRAEAATPAAIAAAIRDPTFDPRTVVLVDGIESGDGGTAEPARYVRESPNRIRITLGGAGSGYLVVSEVNYPGWTARVDGQPAVVGTAFALLQVVRVPAGAHLVTLEFFPSYFYPALALTAIGWLLVVLGVVAVVRRRTRGMP